MTERRAHRQIDAAKQRDRQRQTQSVINTNKHVHIDRGRQSQTHINKDRKRQNTKMERPNQIETVRDTQKLTGTHTA